MGPYDQLQAGTQPDLTVSPTANEDPEVVGTGADVVGQSRPEH